MTVHNLPLPEVSEADVTLRNFKPGGSFILDTDPEPTPVWGRDQEVLWAEGEALIIVGGQGVGKTTLAQQVALGRCGFSEYQEVLGLPVAPRPFGTTLYLAMDRPRQAARSFRRMVGEAWREELDDSLFVWQGPPVVDIAKTPSSLLGYAEAVNASTVVVDSLKDAAIGLSEDEVGAGWNRARQMLLRSGVELIELHHNRKAPSGPKSSPTIDDVYGSTWITSGAGSVILLSGSPGDPVVKLHHLKQPSEEVGPLQIVHDHEHGRTSIWHATDLLAVVSAIPGGMSAVAAARVMFETEKPTASEKEKARRRLERLVSDGLLSVVDEGDQGASRPKLWGPR